MLDYLPDLQTDFLMIGHVDPMSLDSCTFFYAAERMGAYDGALTARIMSERGTAPRATAQPLAATSISDPDLFEMG